MTAAPATLTTAPVASMRPAHAPMTQFGTLDGELVVGGFKLSRLMQRVGQTPFFAYDRSLLDARVSAVRTA